MTLGHDGNRGYKKSKHKKEVRKRREKSGVNCRKKDNNQLKQGVME
jgi:hypothetical protein